MFKRLAILLLLISAKINAQTLSALKNYQDSLTEISKEKTSTQDVQTSAQQTSSTSKKCEETDQTSLPLSFVTSLLLEKNAHLSFSHDQRLGKLSISSPAMISNCSSMLDWTLKKPEIQGQKAYAVEVKIKSCANAPCSYKVALSTNGEFDKFEERSYSPNLKGFEKCLVDSGVIKNGKVDSSAIYKAPLMEKFDGLSDSGQIFFLSNGPSSASTGPKYGDNFNFIDGCDHYESAHPSIKKLLTYEDAQKEILDAEAAKLRNCKVDEYGKLVDFIEKYEAYASELGQIAEELIKEAAKKAALNIEKGTYNEEDLKVIEDFDRYIVGPKIDLATGLYQLSTETEGEQQKAIQEQLKVVLGEISALGKKPYFLSSHTQKLIKDSKFSEAEKLNNIKLSIINYQRLGARENNILITPDLAAKRVAQGKINFAEMLEKEQERYEYRTGQSSGKASYYSNLSARMRNNIQIRSQNFTEEINAEYARIQPGGYCYRYFRNTQKCIQESQERIQELQAQLLHYNQVDLERANEYDGKAKEYQSLEEEGRRYLAAENGEEVPEPTQSESSDNTRPVSRTEDNMAYTFNYPGSQYSQQNYQQQAQMMPPQYQQPYTPYQNLGMFQGQNPYGYQPSYMGYQGFQGYGQNMSSAYNFNWNGGGFQSQYPSHQNQGQFGYWNSPYQAYGQYRMGGAW